jgi:hypothetical protein
MTMILVLLPYGVAESLSDIIDSVAVPVHMLYLFQLDGIAGLHKGVIFKRAS